MKIMSATATTVADPKKTANTTKWWSIGGAIVILIIAWLLVPSSSKNSSNRGGWFAPHPNDLVERTPGVFVPQGVKAEQAITYEQSAHPVPGARPGQVEGDIVCTPGVMVTVYTNLTSEMKISLDYRTTSPYVEYVKRYNGSEYQKVTNSASALPVESPPSKSGTATAKIATVASTMSITVPTDQRFTDLTVHWKLCRNN